jgi:hypothetical protein
MTVLPAAQMLSTRGKELGPVTIQFSAAVTHCIQAAPHFAHCERMEGLVNPPASGVEPGPSCMSSDNFNHLASQLVCC